MLKSLQEHYDSIQNMPQLTCCREHDKTAKKLQESLANAR